MTDAEAREYWRDKAQKHERLWKSSQISPHEIAELRDKADKFTELERQALSERDQAVLAAKEQAEAEAAARFKPQLVAAKLEAAAAAKGVSSEQLSKALEFVDSAKFLNDDGNIDTDKVSAFVDGITPAKGTPRRGPTATGHGSGTGTSEGAPSGRELFEARRGKKSTSAT